MATLNERLLAVEANLDRTATGIEKLKNTPPPPPPPNTELADAEDTLKRVETKAQAEADSVS